MMVEIGYTDGDVQSRHTDTDDIITDDGWRRIVRATVACNPMGTDVAPVAYCTAYDDDGDIVATATRVGTDIQ